MSTVPTNTDAATIAGADHQWEDDGTINHSGDPVLYSFNLDYGGVLLVTKKASTSSDDLTIRLNNDVSTLYQLLHDDKMNSANAPESTLVSGTGGAG